MNEREIVLSPEQYALLEAELRKFELGTKFRSEYQAEWVDAPQPQLMTSNGSWPPAPNRKQRRAMAAVARRARR